MSRVSTFRHASWTSCPSAAVFEYAARALETGDVLFLPDLPFGIEPDETFLCSPAIIAGGKNISFDPASGRLGGSSLRSDEAERLRQMLSRFSALSQVLVEQLFPFYAGRIVRGRASFRPVEIEGRATSW